MARDSHRHNAWNDSSSPSPRELLGVYACFLTAFIEKKVAFTSGHRFLHVIPPEYVTYFCKH